MNEVVLVIPTYNGVERLAYLLKTAKLYDPEIFKTPILVVEDPCGRKGISEAYEDLCEEYCVSFDTLPTWSNMHGAARAAFDFAIKGYDPKWIIYLGDDLAITPGSLTNMVRFLESNALNTVGLVQFPYWNANELGDRPKENWFYQNTNWPMYANPNPHWNGAGYSRPYINVNGAGFACRAQMYRDVGGFAEGTWCLDESISWRCWTQSPYSIVTLPGPPFVHYFGGSLHSGAPKHDLFTDEAWEKAIGFTKQECDRKMRGIMAERSEAVIEEMRTCIYESGRLTTA